MTKRMKILLGVAGALGLALLMDRLVLSEKEADISPPIPNIQASKPRAKHVKSNSFLLPSLHQFNAIWKRPLFVQSRAPIAQKPTPHGTNRPQSQSLSDQPPSFEIMGVAIRPGGGTVLIQMDQREMVRVNVGEEIKGWRIETLTTDTVIMSKDGQSWQLPIGKQN